MNLYGPSDRDDPGFFENLTEDIRSIDNEDIIIGGDWNVPISPVLDTLNYRTLNIKKNSRQKISEMLVDMELIDIHREMYPDKREYTWRRFNSTQEGRLDYFLVSEELSHKINLSEILPGYRSDHKIVCLGLNLHPSSTKNRQYWKFNNSLLKDPTYVALVKKIISETKTQYVIPIYDFNNLDNIPNDEIQFVIDDQLFFETLLLEIRGRTVSYACHKKKENRRVEDRLVAEITILDKKENKTDDDFENLKTKNLELEQLRNLKIQGMMIRSRIQWIQQGEKPSKYFCNLEKRNFISKQMNYLEKNDGELIFDNNGILNETKEFYEKLYSLRNTVNVSLDDTINDQAKLNDLERESIEGEITYPEALLALKSMKNNKSPGSDGFTCEFYKFFFTDIGDFLIRSLNYGFRLGCLSVTQRQGIITCIPKDGKDKRYIKNWRPISLLNTSYKIASSVIANRIKQFLHNLISPDQRGFMTGRFISENIRILYDVLKFTEEEKLPGLVMLVDFEKAFDSIAWNFIENVLAFLNFGPMIIKWVKTFYNDISSCISLNGTYSAWFKICRGVRQGDPLSPYLYLLCAEILSSMLRENDIVKGIKIKDEEVMLSQFADDTALCLDGSEESFAEAVRILSLFASMSGLKINFEKTQVTWIGSRKHCNIRFMRDMNFVWDPGTFKYLGVTFSTNTASIVDLNFADKLNEIRKLLNTWKKRHLTPFGKICVIKTLAVAKITHLLVSIPDPDTMFLKN